MSSQAVFLDKDGTLIEDVPYNINLEHIRLMSMAGEGLRLLHRTGYQLIVISNQSGVARGYFSEAALVPVEQQLQHLLSQIGVPLAGFYYCPHHPEGIHPDYAIACTCRKPEPGLILRAAQDHNISLTCSWFIGDILHDVEAGNRAGCRTILIDNGNETEWQLSPQRLPNYLAADLATAAKIVIDIDQAGITSRVVPNVISLSLDSPTLSKVNKCL